MKKKYNIKIQIGRLKKNKVGIYLKYFEKYEKKYELIKLDKRKILEFSYKFNISVNISFYFVLFHEIGHLLIDRSICLQNEVYADYLSLFFLKNLLNFSEKDLKFFNKNFNLINYDTKIKLDNLGELYIYQYKKNINNSKSINFKN